MSGPVVSVVIPSYNHGRFIEQTVDSVLGSSFPDFELVIVDDGSTDDTLDVLKPYRADPRVRIRTQENRGAHAALNVGLSLVKGELVLILNSDDVFHRERIKKAVDRFRADPFAVVVSSWLQVVDADGNELGVKQGYRNMPPWPPATDGPLLSALGDTELALLETNFVSTTSNVAFRRTLLDGGGGDFMPLRFTHDWDFLLSAASQGAVSLIEEPLIQYRVHGDNTIKEGERLAKGEMRFEVMWTVCRHARALCRRKVEAGLDADDVRLRMWRSLPRFGCDTLLAQLLALRGSSPGPPAAYDALLEPAHPFRIAAIETLAPTP
jgi:glycosyltransferase involved in cell wall biosynthesis